MSDMTPWSAWDRAGSFWARDFGEETTFQGALAVVIREAEQAAAAQARAEERARCAVKIATFFDWCEPIGEHVNMAVAQQFAEEGAAALCALGDNDDAIGDIEQARAEERAAISSDVAANIAGVVGSAILAEREACAKWHDREEARARLKAGEMLRIHLEEAKDCYCAVAKSHAKSAAAIRARSTD